jgi:hypothetical protein
VSIRRLLALALVAGLPGIAKAQFTTFIPPRNALTDSVKAAVVAEKVQADSVTHAQLTNMKTWVDSAAGLVPTRTAADSLARGTATTAAESTTFRNGARAPATASDLPLLLLAGAALFIVGLIVLRSPPRAVIPRRDPRA